ncbi:MAG: hypothetical protein R3F21_09765 [Myxococcota bacterium]
MGIDLGDGRQMELLGDEQLAAAEGEQDRIVAGMLGARWWGTKRKGS